MPNHRRGEIEALLDGRPHILCLTLGALAELEVAFGDESMLALARRFESGQLSARDCIRIIAAGLRGSGQDVSEVAVARMQAEGGIAGYVDIVARLLQSTFAPPPGPEGASPTTRPHLPRRPGAARATDDEREVGTPDRPFQEQHSLGTT